MKVTLDLDLADLESMLGTKYREQIVKQLVWTVGSYDRSGGEKKYYLSAQISRIRHTYLWKDLTVQWRTYNPSDRFTIYNDHDVMSGVFHSWDEIVCWCVENGVRFDTDVKLCHDQYETFFFKKKGVAFGPQFPDETQATHWMSCTTNEPWLIEGSDPLSAYELTTNRPDKDLICEQFAKAFHMQEETWQKLLQKQQ